MFLTTAYLQAKYLIGCFALFEPSDGSLECFGSLSLSDQIKPMKIEGSQSGPPKNETILIKHYEEHHSDTEGLGIHQTPAAKLLRTLPSSDVAFGPRAVENSLRTGRETSLQPINLWANSSSNRQPTISSYHDQP
jgi:hypothetical protein